MSVGFQNSDAFFDGIVIECPYDEQAVQKILESDPVVQEFLNHHPSSEYLTSNEPENPYTILQYIQNGLSLTVSVLSHYDNGECYRVYDYGVSYQMPSSGLGVSLDNSQYFNANQTSSAIQSIQDLTNPRHQMKMGIPIHEIKCKEGLYPTFKIDRVTPACVTDGTMSELLMRGWSPLRLGMPASTNIVITYDAKMIHPMRINLDFNSEFLMDNMVYWINSDVIPHTIVAQDNSWSVGPIESGGVVGIAFNQTGIYQYHIKENPNKTATIKFEIPES